MKRLSAMGAAALALAAAGTADSTPREVSPAALRVRLAAVSPILLNRGPNSVPDLAGDGRSGLIVEAWRDNGNAHGFTVFMTLLPTGPGARDWNVVGVADGEELQTTVTDAPHTGEDHVRSVRFVRARLDGRPASLLITATRDLAASGAIPDPAPVRFEVYELRRGGDVGETQDLFEPVLTARSAAAYCNSDMALHVELKLPLPAGYGGSPKPSGC